MVTKTITHDDIVKAIENNDSFHGLHEELMHKLGKVTVTDEANHTRNLYRAEQMRPDNQNKSRMKYVPYKFKGSFIEDEFAEFRTADEKAVSA